MPCPFFTVSSFKTLGHPETSLNPLTASSILVVFAFFVYKDIITTTASVFWPVYRITCVSQHPWPRNGGFYRRKVSVPVCCCWRQLRIGMREKTLEFSSSVPVLPGNGSNSALSLPHISYSSDGTSVHAHLIRGSFNLPGATAVWDP